MPYTPNPDSASPPAPLEQGGRSNGITLFQVTFRIRGLQRGHTYTHTTGDTHKDRPRESAGRLVPGGAALSKSQSLDYHEAFFSVVVDKFGGATGRTSSLLAGDVGDLKLP